MKLIIDLDDASDIKKALYVLKELEAPTKVTPENNIINYSTREVKSQEITNPELLELCREKLKELNGDKSKIRELVSTYGVKSVTELSQDIRKDFIAKLGGIELWSTQY